MAGSISTWVKGAAVAALALGVTPVLAGEFGVSEVRLGTFVTGLELPYFLPAPGEEQFVSLDTVDFQVLFDSPEMFGWIGSPRPEIGATISMLGRESLVHGSLVWQYHLGDTPIFAEGSLGISLNNGAAEGQVAPARNLGCNFAFYWTLGLGAQLNEQFSMTAQVYHSSHAGICGVNNEGLNGAGLKLGYKF